MHERETPVLALVAGAPFSGRTRWIRSNTNRLPKAADDGDAGNRAAAHSDAGEARRSGDERVREWSNETAAIAVTAAVHSGRSFTIRTTLADDPHAENAIRWAHEKGVPDPVPHS